MCATLLLFQLVACGNADKSIKEAAVTSVTANSQNNTNDSQTEETLVSVTPGNIRRTIPTDYDAACKPVENPGDRSHCSFFVKDSQYIFTQTENLWLYKQAKINSYETDFMLVVQNEFVQIMENTDIIAEADVVYSAENIEILKTRGDIPEIYVKVYDIQYHIVNWSELVKNKKISETTLYEELAQLSSAIMPTEKTETLTTAMEGLGSKMVFGQYRFAYRTNHSYSGFICCSPTSSTPNYDSIGIYMSTAIPEWDTCATIRIETTPDYASRFENTGLMFGEYSIMVDYMGALTYYVIVDGGQCICLDASDDNYSPEEAAYIFNLVFCQ